jgi:hypothetical protein
MLGSCASSLGIESFGVFPERKESIMGSADGEPK